MPLTKLDTKAALILIDLQKGIIGLPTAHVMSEVLGNAVQLVQAFRESGRPVVLVNVSGRAPGRTEAGPPKFVFPPDWTEFAPELQQQPNDYVVTKQRVGAFLGTSLDEYLRGQEVTQIIIAGVATSGGVEATARSAYDLGYNVVFAVDAMTDLSADAHRLSIELVFPRIGETDSTENLVKAVRG